MKNIELKIVLADHKSTVPILRKMKSKFKGKLLQVDTYYKCSHGRLKLREINNKNFELIYYQRPDRTISKLSSYEILKLNKEQIKNTKAILKNALGEKIIVKKERNLWIYKNTRIHLDRVSGLGNFLELETVIDKISLENARNEHQEVIRLMNIANCEKISKSYSDLLRDKKI